MHSLSISIYFAARGNRQFSSARLDNASCDHETDWRQVGDVWKVHFCRQLIIYCNLRPGKPLVPVLWKFISSAWKQAYYIRVWRKDFYPQTSSSQSRIRLLTFKHVSPIGRAAESTAWGGLETPQGFQLPQPVWNVVTPPGPWRSRGPLFVVTSMACQSFLGDSGHVTEPSQRGLSMRIGRGSTFRASQIFTTARFVGWHYTTSFS